LGCDKCEVQDGMGFQKDREGDLSNGPEDLDRLEWCLTKIKVADQSCEDLSLMCCWPL
jgi:hypothetical protein